MKETRARAWTFIVYPDSAPKGWELLIDELHLEWACSPLHDKDLNPTGEQKKPHWHVVLIFNGMKSYDQICEISETVNGTAPQKCHNVKSLVRYFCHLDNPEKQPYSWNEIRCFGGIDIDDLNKPSSARMWSYIAEIEEFIDENHITEFSDLARYCRVNRPDDWFVCTCQGQTATVLRYYLSSFRHSQKSEKDVEKKKELINTLKSEEVRSDEEP